MKKTFLSLVLLVSMMGLQAAPTGITDNFSDANLATFAPGWTAASSFTLLEQGSLKISGAKASIWDGFDFQFPAMDLSAAANRVVSFKIRSNSDLVIICALGNTGGVIDGYPTNSEREVIAGTVFQTLTFDFSKVTSVTNWGAINSLHFVVNPLSNYPGGGVGGSAAWILLDDVKIGADATLTPQMSLIGNQAFTVSTSAVSRTIPLLNISNNKETTSAITITATSSNTAVCANPTVTYTSPNKTGSLTIITKANAVGTSIITLTTTAVGVASPQVMTFNVIVSANAAPTLTEIAEINAPKGVQMRLPLQGISDGNPDVVQSITITSTSSATSIIPNPTVVYTQGSTVGELVFTPSASAAGGSTATITVTVKDNGGTANSGVDELVRTFLVKLTNGPVNNAPTIAQLTPVGLPAIPGTGKLNLGAVTDGDTGSQVLTVTATSTNTGVITINGGSVVDGKASLDYTLTGTIGTSTIKVTIKDNGGTPDNNGDQSTVMSFDLSTITPPVYGYATTFPSTDVTYWSKETGITTVEAINNTMHIRTDLPANSWPGVFFDLKAALGGKELDMSKNKFLSMQIMLKSTNVVKPGIFTVALFDQYMPGSPESGYAATMKEYSIPCDNQYHDITIDYRNLFRATPEHLAVDSTRINGLLFNFDCTWFNTTGGVLHAGDYTIKNLKIGELAENNPSLIKVTNIDGVSNVTMYKGQAPKPVKLTGISDGDGHGTANITFTTNKVSLIKNLAVSTASNGEANLTFDLGVTANALDSAKISVYTNNTAHAGSIKDTAEFTVYVIDPASAKATVTVNPNTVYQTIDGMGGTVPSTPDPNLMRDALDLNYTIARIFTAADWEDVNDNSDPNVMALENFNFNKNLLNNMRLLNEKTNCKKMHWCSLSPPYWQKANKSQYPFLSAQGYATTNVLKPEMEDEFAETVVAAFRASKEYAGVELHGFSIQNEPEFNEPYPSAQMYGPQFVRLFKNIGPKLAAAGFTGPRLMGSDDIFANMGWVTSRIDAIKADPAALKEFRTMTVHNYDPNGISIGAAGSSEWIQLKALKASMPTVEGIWQSETSGFSNKWEGEYGKDYMNGTPTYSPGPLVYAANIYTAFKFGNINGWIDLYDPSVKVRDNLIGGVFKQFSKLSAVPGAKMIEANSNDNDILSVGFKNAADDSKSIVLINRKKVPQLVTITGTGVTNYRVFTTQNNAAFVEGEPSTNGVILLPPRSISTIYNGNGIVNAVVNPSELNENSIEVYPNPASDMIKILNSSDVKCDKVEIFNLTGSAVISKILMQNTTENTVMINELPRGVYLVKISNRGTNLATKKLVVK